MENHGIKIQSVTLFDNLIEGRGKLIVIDHDEFSYTV